MGKYIFDTNLKGKHSKFNRELYEKYDLPAREKIKKQLGNFVMDNPDEFKQDLIITDKNFKYKYIELQVCTTWVGDTFPFDNVYIYERKNHYGADTLFITLDKHMTKGYIFDGQSYDATKMKRIKKYSREFIYPIHWHRIMPIIIDTLTQFDIEMY